MLSLSYGPVEKNSNTVSLNVCYYKCKDMQSDINPDIVRIISNELGQNSADLFITFYRGFSYEEQLSGAKELLTEIVGIGKTYQLLSRINRQK